MRVRTCVYMCSLDEIALNRYLIFMSLQKIIKSEFSSTFRDKVFFVSCGLHNYYRVTRRKNTYNQGALRVWAHINLNFYHT